MSASRAATDIDRHIGAQLRAHRKAAGLSQIALAERLGVSFQQIQKYERATNRISASKLHEAAQTLGVSLRVFFSGLEPTDETEDGATILRLGRFLASELGADLAEALMRIRSPTLRRRVIALAVALATDAEAAGSAPVCRVAS